MFNFFICAETEQKLDKIGELGGHCTTYFIELVWGIWSVV